MHFLAIGRIADQTVVACYCASLVGAGRYEDMMSKVKSILGAEELAANSGRFGTRFRLTMDGDDSDLIIYFIVDNFDISYFAISDQSMPEGTVFQKLGKLSQKFREIIPNPLDSEHSLLTDNSLTQDMHGTFEQILDDNLDDQAGSALQMTEISFIEVTINKKLEQFLKRIDIETKERERMETWFISREQLCCFLTILILVVTIVLVAVFRAPDFPFIPFLHASQDT